MDQISNWKKKITEILKEDNLFLYDLQWVQDGKMKILQVSIMDSEGKMDIDTCAEVSSKVSDMLDEEDSIPYEYYLEVCSPGAERELRSEEEIKDAVGEYVYVKFINPKDGMDDIVGYLLEVNDDNVVIQYMDKATKKKKEVAKSNIKLIRLSVKL